MLARGSPCSQLIHNQNHLQPRVDRHDRFLVSFPNGSRKTCFGVLVDDLFLDLVIVSHIIEKTPYCMSQTITEQGERDEHGFLVVVSEVIT